MTGHTASVRVHYPAERRVYLAECLVCAWRDPREFATRAEAQHVVDAHTATHTHAA